MNKIIKTISRILLFAAMYTAMQTTFAQTASNSNKPGKQTLVLTATEMSCNTDKKMVETALYRKVGVRSVKINGETITIVYNPAKVKPEDLKKTVENTGTCEDPNAKVHKVEIKAQ